MNLTNKVVTDVLSNLGIESFNDMQVSMHDAIISSNEVMLLAPTGSGKTLAFLWPLLTLLKPGSNRIQCLILTPTRELALQIESVWKKIGSGFKVNTCYGGHSMQVEIQNFSSPPALLIGTPGRIEDHLKRNSFVTDELEFLVLDEFDKALQLGFQDQMASIILKLNNLKKKILVSATPSPNIPKFVQFINPNTLDFISDENSKLDLKLLWVRCNTSNRIHKLIELVSNLKDECALIFCNLRETTEVLYNEFLSNDISATFYHGGLEQEARELALIRFRNGSVNFLISTDLAARGLDIPEMKHVIHFELPLKLDEFIHRNGRTARMNTSGTVFLFAKERNELPDYIDEEVEEFRSDKSLAIPSVPLYTTIYISGGKKSKINKVDIVGFFTQKGKLLKDDIGLIFVKEYYSFAAVKTNKVSKLLKNIELEKMKGKKYRIHIAK
ncbi:MAG: DEAD/DEAH box helicase [Saprospiraceae bacterium]